MWNPLRHGSRNGMRVNPGPLIPAEDLPVRPDRSNLLHPGATVVKAGFLIFPDVFMLSAAVVLSFVDDQVKIVQIYATCAAAIGREFGE